MGKLISNTAVVVFVVLCVLSVIGTSVLVSRAVLGCGVVVVSSVVSDCDTLVNSTVLGIGVEEVPSVGVAVVGHKIVKSRMDVIGVVVVCITAVDSNVELVSDSPIVGSEGGSVELHSVNTNKGQFPYEGLSLSNEYVCV